MKIIATVIILLLTVSNACWAINNNNFGHLEGKITDKSGNPIIGATIYFPDMKTGAVTDTLGIYQINNLSKRNLIVQIAAIGYNVIAENIDLRETFHKDFILNESVVEMNEIVVTGQSGTTQILKMPTPMSIVGQKELLQTSSTNIIDVISSQPGISQITTGGGISKPVIRGLGYNRVVVLNDGVKQEGQQWGDEHGIEIDENEVSRVEILKGPASLMYGSDAMAGVINFISAPFPSQGNMCLKALANYQTNNGLMAYSLNFAGQKDKFVWDFRHSNKKAHAYQNRQDGYVFNSGFAENAISGLIGVNNWWGYSHFTLSAYQLTPGIIEGNRESITGKFTKSAVLENGTIQEVPALNSDFLSYNMSVPYQKVGHYKAVWNNNILIGDGSLKAIFGYQQNQRKEFGDILSPKNYGLYFQLHTFTYNLQYQLPKKNGWDLNVGTNGMYQNSMNKGIEFLIPDYRLFDAGIFMLAKKSWDKLNVSGGIRYDHRLEKGDALYLNSEGIKITSAEVNSVQRFKAFTGNLGGVSGSLGLTYDLTDNWNTKLNLSRGFRAPNISEFGSNGVHEGTMRYELGNSNLHPEFSMQLDYELGYNSDHISAKLNIFENSINNFIYSRKLNGMNGNDSILDGFSVFQYNSGDAQLFGGEAYIDFHPHPLDWFHFENSLSFVNAQLKNQPDSMKYLPFTPAAKWKSDVRADFDKINKHFKNGYVSIGLEHYFKQEKIYAAFNTETVTPAYTLINASLGVDVISRKKTLCSFYINGTNLTDIAYQSHLSRLKYTSTNNFTGKTGIYNMGRNISFKLIVPVDF